MTGVFESLTSRKGLTANLIISVSLTCLGSLQFGYHMAELNSPESIISCRESKPGNIDYGESFFGSHGFERCIALSTTQLGLVTSIFSIGGLIGSFYVGTLADKIGRKKTSLLHCGAYFVGSTINGLANDYITLLFGRFLAGLGAGSALVLTSLLINEISPAHLKGLLGSMNQVSINVGILLTQSLSLFWCDDNSWRLLLFTAAVIGFVNFVFLLVFVDESPVWLLHNGHQSKAVEVLHKLRGGDYDEAKKEVVSWNSHGDESSQSLLHDSDVGEEYQQQSGSSGSSTVGLEEYLKSSEFNRSKLVSTGILVFQQFDGINSIIFYGVSVLVSIFPSSAIIINCLISLVNVVVTFASATVVDKLGRKPLLLTSVTFLGISTALMGVGIIFTNSFLSIVGTFTYITFFAIGLGPIPFMLVGEVTQPKAKASAQSWGTTMNWLATFIVGYSFPVLKNSWIGGGVYFIFTFMCALSYWFIQTQIPETKGKDTYEEVWGLTRIE